VYPDRRQRQREQAEDPVISIVRRGSATASVRTSRMGRRFVALFRGATAGTAARIEAVTREGLPVVRTITYDHMKGVCAKGV
jgi:hypothetical protein